MTPDLRPELQPLNQLLSRIDTLEARVQELEATKPVPAVIPLRDFPAWYQAATGSPEPPVTEHQLRRWVSRPEHFRVDWLVRDGRSLAVDAERWITWRRAMGSGVRVGEGKSNV